MVLTEVSKATKKGPGVGGGARREGRLRAALKKPGDPTPSYLRRREGNYLKTPLYAGGPPKAEPVESTPKPVPKSIWRNNRGKFALGTGAALGATYLYRQHHQPVKKSWETTMQIQNPFDGQSYEVSKSTPHVEDKGSTGPNGAPAKMSMKPTPDGFTGASQDGLKLIHVRGKNTKPRANSSWHFTGKNTSERRVSSSHVKKNWMSEVGSEAKAAGKGFMRQNKASNAARNATVSALKSPGGVGQRGAMMGRGARKYGPAAAGGVAFGGAAGYGMGHRDAS